MTLIGRCLIATGLLAGAVSYEFSIYSAAPSVYSKRPHVDFLALGSFGGCAMLTCKSDGSNGCQDSPAHENCSGSQTGCSQSDCPSSVD